MSVIDALLLGAVALNAVSLVWRLRSWKHERKMLRLTLDDVRRTLEELRRRERQ